MQLRLYRKDLRPEYAEIACRLTQFEHFQAEVQSAIQAVGRATFYDREGTPTENYNIIYPPK